MSQINSDRRPREQRIVHLNETQQKMANAQEKKGNAYEVGLRLLFLTVISLFSIVANVSLKCKVPKTINDIILSLDYYN